MALASPRDPLASPSAAPWLGGRRRHVHCTATVPMPRLLPVLVALPALVAASGCIEGLAGECGSDRRCESWPCSDRCEPEVVGTPVIWTRAPDGERCFALSSPDSVPSGWEIHESREACMALPCDQVPAWVYDPATGSCLELESGCEVPVGVEYFLALDDCEGAPEWCDPDRPCPEGLVCERSSCDASEGVCVPLPGGCGGVRGEMAPFEVCGCDRVTYVDDCERLVAGVALDHRGACD